MPTGGVPRGVFFGWHKNGGALDTPKHHATHETHAIHAIACICNGPPSRYRRHRFFRGKKRHAAGVGQTSPLPRPRAGGCSCEPFNCARARMQPTCTQSNCQLGIRVALSLSLLYSWQSQRDQSNRPNKFKINKIMTKTRSPVCFFTGPCPLHAVGYS